MRGAWLKALILLPVANKVFALSSLEVSIHVFVSEDHQAILDFGWVKESQWVDHVVSSTICNRSVAMVVVHDLHYHLGTSSRDWTTSSPHLQVSNKNLN
eukprot:SAG11_NODE_2326_length_3518_cov_401.419713_6_plen_99_part_00